MKVKEIGPAQRRVLRVYRDYIREYGYQPSIRDVCRLTGVRSTNAVMQVMSRLMARKLLEHSGIHGRARSIQLTEAGETLLAREDAGLEGAYFQPAKNQDKAGPGVDEDWWKQALG